MSLLKKIGFGLVALIAVFLVYVALQSPEYAIAREVTIDAPAEKVFPHLNSSKLAQEWMPWRADDPEAQVSYAGPEAGVGSESSWAGKKLGTGKCTILESKPNERVGMKIEYKEPFQMVQDAEYLLRSEGNKSVVTWRISGRNSFFGRVMCSFMSMDKHVGGMFDKGLNNLKTIVEKKG